MGYPSKGNSYLDLKSDASIAKIDQDKLKQFAKQLKSMFATKIELKDKNLERGIENFLILNIQDYFPLKSIDDHKEFISINEIDRIINNLDIKKAPRVDRINNKQSNMSNLLSKIFYISFLTCASTLTFIVQTGKLRKQLCYIKPVNQKI